jgi:hypothetical protein
MDKRGAKPSSTVTRKVENLAVKPVPLNTVRVLPPQPSQPAKPKKQNNVVGK